MYKKPTLRKGPASNYASPNEMIWEFGDGSKTTGNGGLLSLQNMEDGSLIVDVYQVTGPVVVRAPNILGFTPAELNYLARCVDLGRSDPEASAILPPDERDDLLRKLGGRRTGNE